MEITVKGKNIEVTPGLKAHAEKKAGKIERIFLKKSVEAQVTLRIERGLHICDVTMTVDGLFLMGEERSDDMYASIDGAFDKVERQVMKHKTRINDKFRQTGGVVAEETHETAPVDLHEGDTTVVRVKRFAVKPMSTDEAVMQMDLLGHDFFVYRDMGTEAVSVVYRRRDGRYGLIEPEV